MSAFIPTIPIFRCQLCAKKDVAGYVLCEECRAYCDNVPEVFVLKLEGSKIKS